MLCKNIKMWCRHRTFLGKTDRTYHSNQQQQTRDNLLICMNSIQSNPLIRNSRSSCSVIMPRYIRNWSRNIVHLLSHSSTSVCLKSSRRVQKRHWKCDKRAVRKRLPLGQQYGYCIANSQNTRNWICTTLMCKNFCRWNIQ